MFLPIGVAHKCMSNVYKQMCTRKYEAHITVRGDRYFGLWPKMYGYIYFIVYFVYMILKHINILNYMR